MKKILSSFGTKYYIISILKLDMLAFDKNSFANGDRIQI